MSYAENPYLVPGSIMAADAAVDERASFIAKTYAHLCGAIAAFVCLEAILLNIPATESLVNLMIGGRFSWLIMLLLFMGVSRVAESWAQSASSPTTQYLGLGLFVVAEAILFFPLLYIARRMDPSIIPAAGIATLGMFGALSAVVFVTRKDFSLLRGILMFGGFAAMGLVVCAIVFQFALGPIFTVAMISLACGYILYHTSNVLHHYRIGQHVAASLALFASVALLFWYVLQLFMSRD